MVLVEEEEEKKREEGGGGAEAGVGWQLEPERSL